MRLTYVATVLLFACHAASASTFQTRQSNETAIPRFNSLPSSCNSVCSSLEKLDKSCASKTDPASAASCLCPKLSLGELTPCLTCSQKLDPTGNTTDAQVQAAVTLQTSAITGFCANANVPMPAGGAARMRVAGGAFLALVGLAASFL